MPEPTVSFSAVTKPCVDALADIQKRVDRASMYAVREAGRKTKQAAKAAAPVYGGSRGVKIRSVKKARKAGINLAGETLGKGELVEGNRIVAGLLRDSISSSRRLKKVGDSYTVKVGPRGPRVHLYASKAEVRNRYMRHGYETAVALAYEIHEKAWAKAMNL